MKRVIIVLIMWLLMAPTGQAQAPQLQWSQEFNIGTEMSARGVIPGKDGVVFFTANIYIENMNLPYLIKTDNTGNMAWKTQMPVSNSDVTSGIGFNGIASVGKNIACSYQTRSDYSDPVQSHLLLINKKNGSIVSEQKIPFYGVAVTTYHDSLLAFYANNKIYITDKTGTDVIHSFDTHNNPSSVRKITTHKDTIYISAVGHNNTGVSNTFGYIEKYNAKTGELLWEYTVDDVARGFHDIDSKGNVYFGMSHLSRPHPDTLYSQYKLHKIARDGSFVWGRTWDQPNALGNGNAHWINTLSVHTGTRTLVLGGSIERGAIHSAYICAKETSNGNTVSEKEWKFENSDKSLITGSAFTKDAQFLVTGNAILENSDKMKLKLQKYNLGPVKVHDQSPQNSFKLNQNYPNPFNPTTTIRYELPQETEVNIAVFNQLGEKIKTLVDKRQHSGFHQVKFSGSNLSSGVYIYRLQTENVVRSKKMILLR